MLSVNFNPSVLSAQNNLTSATFSLSTALERMSTGFRINAAKDDAAGMFVATNLNTKIRGLSVARANVNNGVGLINTASESLSNMNGILNRIRDLAVQGANGVYDDSSRGAMQAEADALTDELFRIKTGTQFNGRKLFSSNSGVSGVSAASAWSLKSAFSPPPEALKALTQAGFQATQRV